MLTYDQQRLLRYGFGGWMLAEILIDPDNKAPLGWPWIGGAYGKGGVFEEISYDSWGVWAGGSMHSDRVAAEVKVTWRQVRAYARTLDENLRARLHTNRAARHTHQLNYQPLTVRPEAVGCGPAVKGQPLTREQKWYAEDVETWKREHERPHRFLTQRLLDQLGALLDEAFPLADGLCRCGAIKLPHLWTHGICDAEGVA